MSTSRRKQRLAQAISWTFEKPLQKFTQKRPRVFDESFWRDCNVSVVYHNQHPLITSEGVTWTTKKIKLLALGDSIIRRYVHKIFLCFTDGIKTNPCYTSRMRWYHDTRWMRNTGVYWMISPDVFVSSPRQYSTLKELLRDFQCSHKRFWRGWSVLKYTSRCVLY